VGQRSRGTLAHQPPKGETDDIDPARLNSATQFGREAI